MQTNVRRYRKWNNANQHLHHLSKPFINKLQVSQEEYEERDVFFKPTVMPLIDVDLNKFTTASTSRNQSFFTLKYDNAEFSDILQSESRAYPNE